MSTCQLLVPAERNTANNKRCNLRRPTESLGKVAATIRLGRMLASRRWRSRKHKGFDSGYLD